MHFQLVTFAAGICLATLGWAKPARGGDPAPHNGETPNAEAGAVAAEQGATAVAPDADEAPAPQPDSGSPGAAAGAPDLPVDLDEVIEIWDERPDKPFDRDTAVRLSGAELAQRGATTLADALALLPDLVVREAGRGGQQLDIRGARKGSIKVIIDGVAVDDPYYGNFDLSSIPVTDIVQVRVSTSPSSPIDGAGGPGGVVEVHTRDAIGPRLVIGRATADTLPTATAASTARMAIGTHWAARLSATGTLGTRTLIAGPGLELEDDRHAAGGAVRLEYRSGARRLVADAWLQDRAFVVPPGEDGGREYLAIDGETSQRLGLNYDDAIGAWKLQSKLYAHRLTRLSSYYSDTALTDKTRSEDILATRMGVAALANRPLRRRFQLIASAVFDTEHADVVGFASEMTEGRSTIAETAAGAQYEGGDFRIDSAIGLAIPIGTGADPWLEGKLATVYRPNPWMSIKLTGARKGRLPTLRERFRGDIGNQALGPEHAWFGEVSTEMNPTAWLAVEVANFNRASTGIIRFDADQASLINTGHLDIRGTDVRVRIGDGRKIRAGASLSFVDAYSVESGLDPLDFLPSRRADGWIGWFATRIQGLVRARYIGRQIDRNTTLPAYAVVDLSVYADLGHGLALSLRVENSLDNGYYIRKEVPAPGAVAFASLSATWE